MASARNLIREEALRQAKLGLGLVDEVFAVPNLVPEKADDGGVDQRSLSRLKTTLLQEIEKLEANEATIAVVGAMKSGKSTTINAIAGVEIMPSRDQPMTTFPTIVTHSARDKTPVLDFPLAEAFERLAARIAHRIAEDPEGTEVALERSEGAIDLRLLAAKLNGGHVTFPTSALGQDDICKLLAEVNDLSRLARTLGVSRDDVDTALSYSTVPRVRIGFQHLVKTRGAGKLSFVDTPGPDEAADSVRLAEISRRQLEEASAIILVANYTLEGGKAAQDVRDFLTFLPAGAHERLYVLANKYDLRRAGDRQLGEAAFRERELDIRRNIASKVFGVFGEEAMAAGLDRVFLTSSRHALVANLSRRAIQEHGALPHDQWWASQFMGDAARIYAEKFRQAPNMFEAAGVLEGADALWAESRFDAPLTQAFESAARNASLILVASCIDKLRGGEMARMFEMLDIRAGAYNAETERLRALVSNLTADLNMLETVTKQVRESLGKTSKEAAKKLKAHIDGALKSVEATIDIYLKTGSPDAAENVKKELPSSLFERPRPMGRASNSIRSFFGLGRRTELPEDSEQTQPKRRAFSGAPDLSSSVYSERQTRIQVTSSSEAKKKTDAIFDAFSDELSDAQGLIAAWMESSLHETTSDTKSYVAESFSRAWIAVKDHIADVLSVEIEPPDVDVQFSADAIFDEALRQKARGTEKSYRTRVVDRAGAGAAIGRWIGRLLRKPEWGRTTETYSTTEHYIEIDEIRSIVQERSKAVSADLHLAITQYSEALNFSLDLYSEEVKAKVTQIRRHIMEVRGQREEDVETATLLRKTVSVLAAQGQDLRGEAHTLRQGIQ